MHVGQWLVQGGSSQEALGSPWESLGRIARQHRAVVAPSAPGGGWSQVQGSTGSAVSVKPAIHVSFRA